MRHLYALPLLAVVLTTGCATSTSTAAVQPSLQTTSSAAATPTATPTATAAQSVVISKTEWLLRNVNPDRRSVAIYTIKQGCESFDHAEILNSNGDGPMSMTAFSRTPTDPQVVCTQDIGAVTQVVLLPRALKPNEHIQGGCPTSGGAGRCATLRELTAPHDAPDGVSIDSGPALSGYAPGTTCPLVADHGTARHVCEPTVGTLSPAR